jgi:hypothetical protein
MLQLKWLYMRKESQEVPVQLFAGCICMVSTHMTPPPPRPPSSKLTWFKHMCYTQWRRTPLDVFCGHYTRNQQDPPELQVSLLHFPIQKEFYVPWLFSLLILLLLFWGDIKKCGWWRLCPKYGLTLIFGSWDIELPHPSTLQTSFSPLNNSCGDSGHALLKPCVLHP